MYKKTITYTDYNGEERTEDFYFNLSKGELMDMQNSVDGGLEQKIRKITQLKSIPKITEIFKELILASYGEKSDDGRRFIKKQNGERLADQFAETEAFSQLYVELSTNSDEATAFVNGIIPQDMEGQAAPIGVVASN